MGVLTASDRVIRAEGKGRGAKIRTSPSHLFLPFRQAVQALAPRLGIWTLPEFGGMFIIPSWFIMAGYPLPLKLPLERFLFDRLPSELDIESGERDMGENDQQMRGSWRL
jgi:hypothetical protein